MNNTNDQSVSPPGGSSQSPQWEREVLEKVLLASVDEQRRSRRWSNFFKGLTFAYLAVVLWMAAKPLGEHRSAGKQGHTAVVDVAGVIAPGQPAGADNVIEGLRAAAEDKNTKGIVLRMNTPGGSPVQSAYIYDEIRKLKAKKPDMPIIAVVADMCASGGYYIASAADKIFVNSASVVGSIGVIMSNFGFVDAMEKLGIERRVMTAGEHKAILDPFTPVDPVGKEHMQAMLTSIHQQFINAVKAGRGDRLKDNPDLFSGLIWTGAEGIPIGLADELGDVRHVAENVIGAKELVNFTPDENLLDRVAHRFGTAFGGQIAALLAPSLGSIERGSGQLSDRRRDPALPGIFQSQPPEAAPSAVRRRLDAGLGSGTVSSRALCCRSPLRPSA